MLSLFASCSTEFERVRSSNNPELILSKGHEFFKKENYVNAQSLYELAIQYYRGRQEAEDLFFNYAYTFFYTGEYVSASHYFGSFARTFNNSPKKEEAEFMSAYSHFKLSPNYKLDQSYSGKAIEAFQEFVNNYPNSPRVTEANSLMDQMRTKLEDKAFAQGKLYYNTGQYQAAVTSLQNMLTKFPGSKHDEEAKYLLVKSSFILAENSVIEKRKERYEESLKISKKYADKLNNRAYKREVADIIKNINNKLNNKA